MTTASGAVCAECHNKLCVSALGSWEVWFAEPAARGVHPAAPDLAEARTHADLGAAYGEMGMVADATLECICAVALDASFSMTSGAAILGQLSADGWRRFANSDFR